MKYVYLLILQPLTELTEELYRSVRGRNDALLILIAITPAHDSLSLILSLCYLLNYK
jgi:hypothetical protein